jgi:transposase
VNDVKALKEDRISPLLSDNEDLELAGSVSKETIDYLTRKIKGIEKVIENRIALDAQYQNLVTIPGVGNQQAIGSGL